MKRQVILATLTLNLLFGNLAVMLFDKDFSLALCCSVSSIFFLLYGFTRIQAESSRIAVFFLGLLLTPLIPFAGVFLYGLLAKACFAEGLLEGIGKSFAFAIISMAASVFLAIPFAVGNIIAFLRFRRLQAHADFHAPPELS